MVVGIIGLGLIGGSLAISLKQRGFATKIIGVDKNEAHLKEANELGFVDEACELNEILNKTDLVLLAIPVDAARQLLPFLLDQAKDGQTIIDMGSTKEGICKVADAHHNRKNFVASHPIAGTENAGPSSAMDGLYDHKITIICDEEKSHPNSIELCNKLYDVLKMRVLKMNAQEHDRHIAYVSHLSHISSFMLGKTVIDKEKNEKNIFDMAGSGFESTVRLAKSSPNTWTPIFEQNKENVIETLEEYIQNLIKFKNLMETDNFNAIKGQMESTNYIKKILKGIS